MNNESLPVHEHDHCTIYSFKRISWTAILIGAIVGVGLSFLLNLFGLAIGLSAFSAGTMGATTIAIGGVIGLIIGLIASMLLAGYAAGYLGRFYCPMRNLGILYGFTTWTLALILSTIVTTNMSQYVCWYSRNILGTNLIISAHKSNNAAITATTEHTNNNKGGSEKVTAVNVTPITMATGAYIVFILFFIGALSSCIGACWAMTCKRED
ncbi:MAG: hypothetical protein PSV35_04180 [bacterium]|nr:hypothetical protein [bacterium]